MTIDPSKVKMTQRQPEGKISVSSHGGMIEAHHWVILAEGLIPEEQMRTSTTKQALDGNTRGQDEVAPADLNQEAANMLELMSRQSTRVTALSISSKQAQAVLRQF